jgi:hypothetical protein
MHHPNNMKCQRFCAGRNDEDWMCYHHEISSDGSVENMTENIEQLQCQLSCSLELTEKESRLKVCSNNHRGHFSESNSIDYNPLGAEDIERFPGLLSDELELQSLDMTGMLEEMRQQLKE